MRKIVLSLMTFLISSCASAPVPVTPVHWQFVDSNPADPTTRQACLPIADVQSLEERLVRCEAAAAQ